VDMGRSIQSQKSDTADPVVDPSARRTSWFDRWVWLIFGGIALVAFGVLMASAEYTTGTIRASLSAVPRRGTFLAAKAFVASGVAV